jgi:hypothetical protein
MDAIWEIRKLSFLASVIAVGSTVEPGMSASAPMVCDTKLLRLSLLGVRRGECNCISDLGRERSGYELKRNEELPSSPRRSGLLATMTEVIYVLVSCHRPRYFLKLLRFSFFVACVTCSIKLA